MFAFCTCVEPVFLTSRGVLSSPFHPEKPAICVTKVLLVSTEATGVMPLTQRSKSCWTALLTVPQEWQREREDAKVVLQRKQGQPRPAVCYPREKRARELKKVCETRGCWSVFSTYYCRSPSTGMECVLQSPSTDFGICFWVVSYKHLFAGKQFNVLLLINISAAVTLWTARLWVQTSLFWCRDDLYLCNNSYLWHTVSTVPLCLFHSNQS